MKDGIKTSACLREDQAVYVKVCDRCKEMFRTNARASHFCDDCDDEMCAVQSDSMMASDIEEG